ncbi:MAG: superoxide dismutase family protein [Fibrobacteres bacterium]|nr:superoxide dismutase family protein [Fibrobacterota bacterium]
MKTPMHSPARKFVMFATISISSALVACSSNYSSTGSTAGLYDTTSAIAALRGYTDSTIRGTVRFRQEGDSVTVATDDITGLTGTMYELQIRQSGNCLSPESSGGAFPPGNDSNSIADSLAGRIQLGTSGTGSGTFRTSVLSLNPSENASIIGRSVVLQARTNMEPPQAGVSVWTNVACGIITQGNVADTSRTARGAY